MIKINDSEGKLFGVFQDESEAREFIKDSEDSLEPIEFMTWEDLPFNEFLDWRGLYITDDTVNCDVCNNELDDDFDEILSGYRCSYCRDNPEMGKYKNRI